MSKILAEYRRLMRRRREWLALIDRLSEGELAALGRCIEIVQEHIHSAVKAAVRDLSDPRVVARPLRGPDVVDMLVELSPNGDKERSWLFIAQALAIWKRLQEQEEATREILQNKELMRQIRESEEDFKAGRREKFIPWEV